MSGEDQERFEDYLELERYIEELQAGRSAHPPANLTPAQARIYRIAALFRSASSEAAEPRPEFAQALRTRLLAYDRGQDNVASSASALLDTLDPDYLEETQKRPAITRVTRERVQETPVVSTPPTSLPAPVAPQEQPVHPPQQTKRARFFSRRGLLGGGAVAAASLLLGAGAERVIEGATGASKDGTSIASYTGTPLTTGPTVPLPITTLDKLGEGPIKFSSEGVIGYIIRNDHDHGETSTAPVIAISAACTHMGCIISWSDTDRQFHCPCHGGAFSEYGKPAAGPVLYASALPRLNVRIVDNTIIVDVPAPPGPSTKTNMNDATEWQS